MCCDRFVLRLLVSACLWQILTGTARSQTVPDDSLGDESSVVTPQEGEDLIEGGALRENNLFHSFSEFNVANGARVYFANPDGVANILTRVTGNNVSNILGTLGVLNDNPLQLDGAANLFLLNPNGIVFGENAALDINGLFLATTAESYLFEDDLAYSATNPNVEPLLSMNLPVGLQVGNNPAAIEVQGTGHNLEFDFNNRELNRDNRTAGLAIDSDNTLALLGGEINLTGGNLTADGGRIELGSVGGGNVALIPTEDGLSLDYEEVSSFLDLNLTQAASIDSSGDIQLRGNNLNLLESSAIINNVTGAADGGEIGIVTRESVNIIGTEGGAFPASIFSQVEAGAAGNGADIAIATPELHINDNNAWIFSTVAGNSDGGDINITANLIDIAENPVNPVFLTGIYSEVLFGNGNGNGGSINLNASEISLVLADILIDTFAEGNGGALTIDTDSLLIKDGAQIRSNIYSDGNGGGVAIAADNIEIRKTTAEGFPSGIFVNVNDTESTGTGGNLDITADSLSVEDGARINVDTFGIGDGGNLNITADSLSVENNAAIEVDTIGVGDGGNLNINVRELVIKDGISQVSTATFASGNAGDTNILASDSIEIGGVGLFNDVLAFSGLFASVESDATGNAGNIIVQTGDFNIANGGIVVTSTSGFGDAGNISLNVNNLQVESTSINEVDVRSGIVTSVQPEAAGDGGNIEIIADRIELVDGGLIGADSFGAGDAGDITVRASKINIAGVSSDEPILGEIQQSSPSAISAFSASDFDAGDISIAAETIDISDRGTISVSGLSDGNSGNLNLVTSVLNLDNSAVIQAEANTGSEGNINLNTDNLFLDRNSLITATARGTSTGGNITLNNSENVVLSDNSQIIANAVEGNGGNINLDTVGYFVSSDSIVSASSQFGLDGNIEIETSDSDALNNLSKLPTALLDRSSQIIAGCPAKEGANFVVTGRGGLPENPSQNLTESVWLSAFETSTKTKASQSEANYGQQNSEAKIIEAEAWRINQKGNVELVATNYSNNLPDQQLNCP